MSHRAWFVKFIYSRKNSKIRKKSVFFFLIGNVKSNWDIFLNTLCNPIYFLFAFIFLFLDSTFEYLGNMDFLRKGEIIFQQFLLHFRLPPFATTIYFVAYLKIEKKVGIQYFKVIGQVKNVANMFRHLYSWATQQIQNNHVSILEYLEEFERRPLS